MKTQTLFKMACLAVAVGIVLGAFAAHGLKDKISPDRMEVFEKGVKYHLIHALALIVLSLNAGYLKEKWFRLSAWLMVLGILFFSGSLYLISTMEINGLEGMKSVIGPITPLGGLCFISAWLVLAFAWNKKQD